MREVFVKVGTGTNFGILKLLEQVKMVFGKWRVESF